MNVLYHSKYDYILHEYSLDQQIQASALQNGMCQDSLLLYDICQIHLLMHHLYTKKESVPVLRLLKKKVRLSRICDVKLCEIE